MKIVSWNVNGLRARERSGFVEAMKKIDADIICLQEVRANPDQLQKATVDFLNTYEMWNINEHEKAGYAGVLIASKFMPDGVFPAFNSDPFNSTFGGEGEKGRQYIYDYEKFGVVCVYSPNSGRDLDKIDHRLEWELDLQGYATSTMFRGHPLIICGDMNVAPDKIDCNVFSKAGTSDEERRAFKNLKELGFVDAYREKHALKQAFTWFSNTYNSREVNKGMRIDHFMVSKELMPKVQSVEIINDPELICGSDHNPIVLTINI